MNEQMTRFLMKRERNAKIDVIIGIVFAAISLAGFFWIASGPPHSFFGAQFSPFEEKIAARLAEFQAYPPQSARESDLKIWLEKFSDIILVQHTLIRVMLDYMVVVSVWLGSMICVGAGVGTLKFIRQIRRLEET